MKDKSQLINAKLNSDGYDAMIIADESTRYWLTGFSSSDGIVVVGKDETALFLDGRYTEKAYAQKPFATIYPCDKGLLSQACSYIAEKGYNNILIESQRTTMYFYDSVKFYLNHAIESINEKNCENREHISIDHKNSYLSEFIAVKDEKEISLIKKAVEITDNCFSHILNFIKKGVTESEIAAEINCFIYKNSCVPAFETIVVSGVKSSMPHGVPDAVLLSENSFITMDFGAKYKGYCSDMTRTVVLGKADEEMKKIYSIVREANRRGIEAAKYSTLVEDVDKAARGYIEEMGYGKYFTHSTGHSLGVEIHEKPTVSRMSPFPLESGNIITVEPGIYIPGKYGVRIEDTVLITETETIVLSQSPKDLIEL